MRALRLKRGEERRLLAGHLWIFSNEVDAAASPLTDFEPGEQADVLDAAGRPLGAAFVNPASLICGRLFSRKAGETLDEAMLRERLARALALRDRLFDRPFYRLCHGEGDFLPGLIADRYDEILVVQQNSAGMDRQRAALLEALHSLLRPACIVLRNDDAARENEGLPRIVETPVGEPPETIQVTENGLALRAPFFPDRPGAAWGQKTGWFFDQRDNRMQAARHARGADVLDAFCYAGGFGAHAANAGARSVCLVDSSRRALDAAEANLNACAPSCAVDVLHGDAVGEQGALRRLRAQGRRFDVVCLDPPAFIKRRKDAAKGLAAYVGLNALGLDLLNEGGILISSSCSHHLSAEEHRRCLARAAAKRRQTVQILHQGGQAADHPAPPAMPESAYLTCFTARVLKK